MMDAIALFDIDLTKHVGPFQMQSWSSRDAAWTAMDSGPAKSVWRPRSTAQQAAVKCLTWTGLVGMPAMQVIDLATGVVVWRDSERYPNAGVPVVPEWDAAARSSARSELQAIACARRRRRCGRW